MRNWWAHVDVCIDECLAALRAIVEFIILMKQHFLEHNLPQPDHSGLDALERIIKLMSSKNADWNADVMLTEDEVAYLYLVRSFRHLSKISQVVMKACPDTEFCKALHARMEKKKFASSIRRQNFFMECVDVSRSILDIALLNRGVKGDCMIIIKARNYFAHEAEQSGRVLTATCAIGAVSHLLDFIAEQCNLVDHVSPFRSDLSLAVSEISDYQGKLLARMGALDLPFLLRELARSHEPQFKQCKYAPLLSKDYEKAMILLTSCMPRHLAIGPPPAACVLGFSENTKMAKQQRSLLRTVMLVPPEIQSPQAAIEWLLSSPLPHLLGCSGRRVLYQAFKADAEGKLSEGSWIEIVPKDSQEFLRELCIAIDELSQSQNQELDAEHACDIALDIALEKSPEVQQHAGSLEIPPSSDVHRKEKLQQMLKLPVVEDHKKVRDCVQRLLEKVVQQDTKRKALLAVESQTGSLQKAKEDLAAAMQSIFNSAGTGDLSWQYIKRFCYLLPPKDRKKGNKPNEDNVHESFYSLFDPAPLFEFFNIFSKKGSRSLCLPFLFDASIQVLAPMFQVPCVNPDVLTLEASLGSKNFFRGMTMLAVLASRSHSLQEKLATCITHPSLRIKLKFNLLTAGMSATVVADNKFIGREPELARLNKRVRSLFQAQDSRENSLVLIRGQPGTGKSSLAKQHLCLVQNEFSVVEHSPVFAHCIPGRGSDAVRNALHRMGLDLSSRLDVCSETTIDKMLESLKKFLFHNCFVLLVDDVDKSGLEELLKHVPASSAGCCIVLTSQMDGIELVAEQLSKKHEFQFDRTQNGDDVHLQCFTDKVAFELVAQICPGDIITRQSDDVKAKLRYVLAGDASSGIGLLPLGVRLFAEWMRRELLRDKEKSVLEIINLWKIECEKVTMPDNPLSGHRGLRATVRLSLQSLRSLVQEDDYDSCKQLLGLLALCPPVEVPWSLFDGGAKGEALLLVRGARVEVNGSSVVVVSSLGERCRVTRKVRDEPLFHQKPFQCTVTGKHVDYGLLRVRDDEGIDYEVPIDEDNLQFDAGSMFFQEGCCKLKLQKLVPAKDAEAICICDELSGRSAVITSQFLTEKSSGLDQEEHTVSLKLKGPNLEERPLRLPVKDVRLRRKNVHMKIIDDQIFVASDLTSVPVSKKKGRVLQYHQDDTVSVIFGCDAGMAESLPSFTFYDTMQVK